MELITERSVKEAYSEVSRELQVRERCFDDWVSKGKMTDIDAQDRFDRMASALHYLAVFKEVLNKVYGMDGASVATSSPTIVTISGDKTVSPESA
jgi:hypothetical protein